MTQINYFITDIHQQVGKKKLRIISLLFSRPFYGVLHYRFERSLFLLFGYPYKYIRLLFYPVFFLFSIISNIEIHYEADIEGGINIHHSSLGIVISGKSIIGRNLTLTGGNVIGINKKCVKGEFTIGSNCNMGANSVILGPLKLGDNIKIGSLACVTKSFGSDLKLIGITAKQHDAI